MSQPPAMPPAASHAALARWLRLLADKSWLLLSMLALLSLLMLGTLVWLTRNHEIEQVQRALERDAEAAAQTLRHALAHNVQDLHSLAAMHTDAPAWREAALAMLQSHREWLRLEWRDRRLQTLAAVDSPYYPSDGEGAREGGDAGHAIEREMLRDAQHACALAAQTGTAAYAPSRYLPRRGGMGEEVMAACLPVMRGQQPQGYALAIYSLGGMLAYLLAPEQTRQSVALTELDGARLAVHGGARPAGRTFTAREVLELPGNALMLRIDGGRAVPDMLPNVLTALVTVLSVALLTVLALLARDFRARQRAERELDEALAFRKAMENSLITGLRARDLRGRITYVNPAFCDMVGWRAEDLLGQSAPAPYWPPEMAQDYTQRQSMRLAGGNAPPREGVESVFMRRDGTRFPVLIIESPLINAQGQHTGWMGAVLDLTAQRQAEERLRASQERLHATAPLVAVGEMASLMSHELNQPLAAISSYASGSLNLMEGAGLGAGADAAGGAVWPDVRTALARIAEQAGRAGRVIGSVHDLVRRRTHARSATAPAALIDAVLPLVQLQARQSGAQVLLDVAAPLPAVWCEPTMVEQALLNLARNGLQAMHGGPAPRELRLRARALAADGADAADGEGGGGGEVCVAAVEFAVSDTGCGIGDEVAAQLYTPFFTTKAQGMGLGLSFCRTVIEQHGGSLRHAPHAPRGTTFTFTLPVHRAGGVQAQSQRQGSGGAQ